MPEEPKGEKLEKFNRQQLLDLLHQIIERVLLSPDLYVKQMPPEEYNRYLKMSEIAKLGNESDRNKEIKKLVIKDGLDDTLRNYFDLLGDQINDVLKNLTWLQMVCEENALETIVAIFTYSKHLDVNFHAPNAPTPFEIACGVKEPDLNLTPEELSRSLNIVKAFLETGKLDVSKCEINPLCTACARSSIQLVHLLLNAKTINLDINKESVAFCDEYQDLHSRNSPLSIACLNNSPANQLISKLLVSKGANFNVITSLNKNEKIFLKIVSDKIPLFYVACINGHIDVIEKCFAHPIPGDDLLSMEFEGKTALHYAVIHKQLEVVKLLIKKGANVNSKFFDEGGNETTAFHQACIDGNVEMVRYLLTCQALNPNSQNKKGITALFAACQNDRNAIVKLLLDQDMIHDLPDSHGVNTLVLACARSNLEILQYYQKKRPGEFKRFINTIIEDDGTGTMFTFLIYAGVHTGDKSQLTPELYQMMDYLLANGSNIEGEADAEFNKDVAILNKKIVTPLMLACNFNVDPIINYLIRKNASTQFALYKTCQLDSKNNQFKIDKRKVCDILIKKGANLKLIFYTLLIEKHKEAINFVIENYRDVIASISSKEMYDNLEKEEVKLLFDIACENDHLDIIKIFLEDSDHNRSFPARFREAFDDNADPLLIACQKNSTKIVDFLIKKGADVNQSFSLALQMEDTKSADLLFTHNVYVGSMFIEACSKGGKHDVKIIEYLLKKVEKPTNLIREGLFIALEFNKGEIVNYLLNHLRKNEDSKLDLKLANGMSLFSLACQKGNLSAVQAFLKYRINVNKPCTSDYFSPLHFACENKHLTIVEELLKNPNLDLNPINSLKETPLYIALRQKQKEIAQKLITKGASKEKVLELACIKGDLEIVKTLIEGFGFDMDRPVDGNATMLHLACQNGHIEIVKFLFSLENKPYVNTTTNDGSTALHLACKKGHDEIAKLLLTEYGADKEQVNDRGEKPADIAKKDNQALKDLFGLNVKTQIDPKQKQHSTLISNSLYHPNEKLIIKKVVNSKEEKDEDKKEFDSPLYNLSTMEEEKKDSQSHVVELNPHKIYTLHDGTLIQLPRNEVHPLVKGKQKKKQFAVDKYEIYDQYEIYYDNKESSDYEAFGKVVAEAKFYPGDAKDKSCIHGLGKDIFSIKIVKKLGSDYRVLGTIIGTSEDGKQLIYFQKTVTHQQMKDLLQNRSNLIQQLRSVDVRDKRVDVRGDVRSVVSGNKT